MVVIERGALLEPEVEPIAIVAIMLEHRNRDVAQTVHDPPDDRGLAGSRSAGHADDEGFGSDVFPAVYRRAHKRPSPAHSVIQGCSPRDQDTGSRFRRVSGKMPR
jgi:hypothetical protein